MRAMADDRPILRLVLEGAPVDEIAQRLIEQRRADAEIDRELPDHTDPLMRLRDDAVAIVSEYEGRREERGDVPDEGCLGCIVRAAIGLGPPPAGTAVVYVAQWRTKARRVAPGEHQMALAL